MEKRVTWNGEGQAEPSLGHTALLPCSCSCAEGRWPTGQALPQLSQDVLPASEHLRGG